MNILNLSFTKLMIVSNKRNSENPKTLMLILAMEKPPLHQMHGKQYLPYLFTSRFRIFSKSSFLKSHKYMNSFMRAHLTSCTAETKPIYASKKNFCLIKPLKYMCVCVCAGVGYLASFFSSTTRDTVQSSRYFEQWGYNLAWAVFALSQI